MQGRRTTRRALVTRRRGRCWRSRWPPAAATSATRSSCRARSSPAGPDHAARRPGPGRQHRPHRPRPGRRGLRRPRRRRHRGEQARRQRRARRARSWPARRPTATPSWSSTVSLAYITPLAVAAGRGRRHQRLRGRHRHLAGRLRPRHRRRRPASDGRGHLAAQAADQVRHTGVGTGSQLCQELLFAQAGIEATAVPFDGGSPTLTAVLGGQVDVGSSSSVRPGADQGRQADADRDLRRGAAELPARHAHRGRGRLRRRRCSSPGPSSAPKGTPQEVLDRLRAAFQTGVRRARSTRSSTTQRMLTPNEVDGPSCWSSGPPRSTTYRGMVEKYEHRPRRGLVTAATGHDPAPEAGPDGTLRDAVHRARDGVGRPPAAGRAGRRTWSSPRWWSLLGVARLAGVAEPGRGDAPAAPAPGTWPLLIGVALILGSGWCSPSRPGGPHDAERFTRSALLVLAGRRDHGRLRRRHRHHRLRDPRGPAGLRLAAVPRPRELALVDRHEPRASSVAFYLLFVAARSTSPIPHLF